MDYGRGVSYIRQDPAWLAKVLIGSLISFVPILNFAALGYALDVLRNVYNGVETPLPEWGENFGDRFVRGLLAAVIQFIYALPIVALMCVMFALGSLTMVATGSEDGAGTPIGMLCMMPFLFAGTLFLSLLGMIGVSRYAITNDFGQALRVGEVLAEFRRGMGVWLGMLVALVLGGLVFGLGVAITCGLGALLGFYFTLVQHHWMAQVYRRSTVPQEPVSFSY
jgi:hypothetical protein